MFEQRNSPELLVFSDDWGRHPSSCQHLIRQLLDRYMVYWVNTIGMRPPRLDWATLRRGVGKFRQWLTPRDTPRRQESSFGNPRILNPRMWPWFTRSLDRRLNRELLLRQLLPTVSKPGGRPVAITTVPVVGDLMKDLPVLRWVYYCVDDFSKWPGLDQNALDKMERNVVQHADVLIAASETLQERLATMGRQSRLLTHGVDLDFWKLPPRKNVTLSLIGNLECPLITFWGVVDRRLDLTFLEKLGKSLSTGTIVLAGPQADPDPNLRRIPRVAQTGRLGYEQLPLLADASAVLIMPYGDLPVTRAMQPLKFKEYLATGKPAVARQLPATRPWADSADLVSSAEEFTAKVLLRLKTGTPEAQTHARRRLSLESWEQKACLFERWLLREEHDVNTCCA